MRWEYQVRYFDLNTWNESEKRYDADYRGLNASLNAMGMDGWELVAMDPWWAWEHEQGPGFASEWAYSWPRLVLGYHFFKRPIP